MTHEKHVGQTQKIMKQIEEILGVTHPVSSALFSTASLEDNRSSIKFHTHMAVERFDERITEKVNKFYQFSSVYRDDHAEEFIENIKRLNVTLSKNEKPFTDKIRWTDDEDQLDKMRSPVSIAYLSIFGKVEGLKVVTDEDFWKCTDLVQLGKDIHKTPHFANFANLFVDGMVSDNVNRFIALVVGLREHCVLLSKNYEHVIERVLTQLSKGEAIAITESIDFEKPQAVLLGVTLRPEVTNVINQRWYKNTLKTSIGSMATDTQFLLKEPLEKLTPNNKDTEESVKNIYQYAYVDHVYDNLKILEREFLKIVDQINLSSKRLTQHIDILRNVPERAVDGTYNYILQDIVTLIAVYSGTLEVVLDFIIDVAVRFEDNYSEMKVLLSKVLSLKQEIDKYISLRDKT